MAMETEQRTESKHTPGPWIAERRQGRYTHQDTMRIGAGAPAFTTPIADVFRPSEVEMMANADLIATAPKMHAELTIARDALQMALTIQRKGGHYEWANLAEDLVLRFSEAIAKARGAS